MFSAPGFRADYRELEPAWLSQLFTDSKNGFGLLGERPIGLFVVLRD